LSELNKKAVTGLFILFAAFFLCLAIMDFQVMNSNAENYPSWLYKYWISLGLIVTIVAATITWVAYSYGASEKQLPAIFCTGILLFVGGLLDLFYYALTLLRGEPYSFEIWSAQYKWFVVTGIIPEWTWTHQILWTSGCFILIALVWRKTLKKK